MPAHAPGRRPSWPGGAEESRDQDNARTKKDRALAERIYHTFERDLALADVKGIHFYVHDGTVALHGIVRHDLDRDLLISVVNAIPGVREVIDHLRTTEGG